MGRGHGPKWSDNRAHWAYWDHRGAGWRTVFTLRPDVFIDLWTPVIIGAIGTCIHLKFLNFPYVKNYEMYSVFMVMTALFANVGYAAKLGVFVAILSVIAALLCVVARLTGERALKTLDIGKA